MKGQIKGKYLQGSLPPVSQEYRDNHDGIMWEGDNSYYGSGAVRCQECGHWTRPSGSGPFYCRKHKVKED